MGRAGVPGRRPARDPDRGGGRDRNQARPGAAAPAAGAPLLGVRGHRPGHRRREDRLRPHHHVEHPPGVALLRLARRAAGQGAPGRDADVPRRHLLRHGLLHQLVRADAHRDDARADPVRAGRHPAGEPRPPGDAVRRHDRRPGPRAGGQEQRAVHERVAHRRREDRRDRGAGTRHARPPAAAQLEERVAAARRRGLLLGLQQHQGPEGAAGDGRRPRRPARRRLVAAQRPRPVVADALPPAPRED